MFGHTLLIGHIENPPTNRPLNSLGKWGHITNVETEDESLKEGVTQRQERKACVVSGRRKALGGEGVLGWAALRSDPASGAWRGRAG